MTAGGTFSGKLVALRPESAGYALMILIPAMAIDYFHDRRWSSLALAATATLTFSQVHGLDWVFSVAMTAGVVVAFGLLDQPRRAAILRTVLIFGLVVGGTWFVGNAVLGGGLSGAGKFGGLPQVVDGHDPTHEFLGFTTGQIDVGTTPSILSMAKASLTPRMAGGSEGWWTLGAVLTLSSALGYASTQHGEPRRMTFPLVLIVVTTLLVVLAFSSWLALTHSTLTSRAVRVSTACCS